MNTMKNVNIHMHINACMCMHIFCFGKGIFCNSILIDHSLHKHFGYCIMVFLVSGACSLIDDDSE